MLRDTLGRPLLSTVTLALLASLYSSGIQSSSFLSPQGCRMSWMSPSYILQPDFNATWTRLSRRYSLWLYREVGWESHNELTGVPVLFIPGNAGSSRQVRSIASSATRQYYADPRSPHPDFESRGIKQLDFFAVEFNEDFSALHGPTLISERSYTSAAIKYILSLYPPDTQIILMGHSMGGIVALSLLPSSDISTIITMSTPHSLPPARLDRRIEDIYSESWDAFNNATTPILSVCGGATDIMIPSETCQMEQSGLTVKWRKTIFTSCMEGTWTGVGHREMVWCHQVRWRIARAALELGIASSDVERGAILEQWFRDGVDGQAVRGIPSVPDDIAVTHIPPGDRLTLRNPQRSPHMYMLPLRITSGFTRFTLYVSRGTVASISPYHGSDFKVSVYRCRATHRDCRPLLPQVLKLIPNPSWGMQFPVPEEGVHEADGVVLFEAPMGFRNASDPEEWIGVTVQGGRSPENWVVAGIESENAVQLNVRRLSPFWSKIPIPINPAALLTTVEVPNVLSNALLVYHVTPTIIGACTDALLPPLLLHTSSPTEAHFHPTDGQRPLLIHSHTHGPFIDVQGRDTYGLNLIVYSSGDCGIKNLELTFDWWSSLGRWGLRYWTTVCAWAVGVVGVMVLQGWSTWQKGGSTGNFPTVSMSLARYISYALLPLSGILLFASFLPLDSSYFLGNSGQAILAPLAPLILFAASGCVAISWYLLQIVMWSIFRITTLFERESKETPIWKRNLWSLGIILLLVATVIPSQVAFLTCFLIHLFVCAIQSPTPATSPAHVEAHSQKTHVLLLLFWLLPLVAPVLAVWVRTLATVGLTTPFDGDHDVFAIGSFLLCIDLASSSPSPLLERASSRLQRYVTMTVIGSLAVVPFVSGGRYTYRVYFISNFAMGCLVAARIMGQKEAVSIRRRALNSRLM